DLLHMLLGLEMHRLELRNFVELAERFELVLRLRERRTRRVAEARFAAVGDVLAKIVGPAQPTDVGFFVQAVTDGAVRGIEMRVLRNEDELLDRNVLRISVAA